MERNEAIMGPRIDGVRERYVEYHRLHHQLALRRHCSTASHRIFTGRKSNMKGNKRELRALSNRLRKR